MKTLPLLCACCAALLLSGCVQQIAVSTMGGIIDQGFEAFTEEADLAFAEQALPGNLKLLEVMLRSEPDNMRLLRLASEGYSSYALAFVEDSNAARAKEFYLRGRDFGIRMLRQNAAWATALDRGTNDAITEALAASDRDDVPAIFWTAFGWGSYINLSLTSPDAIGDLPKAEQMMKFVVEKDSTFYYAGAHLFLGMLDGSRPKMLGGDPQRSRAHFEAAIRLTEGRFLLAYVYYARSYAVMTLDEPLFDDLLKKVTGASLDILPQMRLANAVAQKKARLLMAKKAELF